MAPDIFLAPGAKKVGRHKSSQVNGMCLEIPAPSTEEWRFWSSKKRHSPPFFARKIGRGFASPGATNIAETIRRNSSQVGKLLARLGIFQK